MPMRMNRLGAACVFVALGALMTAGDAAAQRDGVFVDPDTPAGTEYALPLEKARRDVAPDRGARGAEGHDAELFGAGISKRDDDDGGATGGQPNAAEGGAAGRERADRGKERDRSQEVAAIDPRSVAKAGGSSGSGISPGWLTALIALGVLVVGGVAGLSLRALRAS